MRTLLLSLSLPLIFLSACSSSDSDTDDGGAGGIPATGGDSLTGGTGSGGDASGGASTGGTPGTGGAAAGSGGTPDGAGGVASGGESASGGAASGGSNAGAGCSGADIFCETFEDVPDGEWPSGGVWQPEDDSCQYQSGQFSSGVAADNPRGASTKSFKMTNKTNAPCRLVADIGSQRDFWVKAHIYWDQAISFVERETLALDLATEESVSQRKDDPAIRFGFRTKDPCIEVPGPQVTMIGFGEEATGCANREIPQGSWYCFEAHVTQGTVVDGMTFTEVKTYIDGASFSYSSKGKPDTESILHETDVSVNYLRVGIFSTSGAEGNAYVDDVAVSTTRVGCD